MSSEHELHTLPILVMMPHSRCNCRCVMCDIWKANKNLRQITEADLMPHVAALQKLRVGWVVLSGGEALMHDNLWRLCALLREAGIPRISLLSTGLLLARHATEVVRWCDEVIVSLDGSRAVHDAIRRVPRAFDRLAAGIAALRQIKADYRVTARTVVQRENFRDLSDLIDAAHEMGIDRLSLLAADVSSAAFNRPDPWDPQRSGTVALSTDEVAEFADIVEDVLVKHRARFDAGFISAPDKLREIVAYYGALRGIDRFPPIRCNAPWVSAVLEADGVVRPCFFLDAYGNLGDRPIDEIVNDPRAVAFRAALDPATDARCHRCVCTLQVDDPAELLQPLN